MFFQGGGGLREDFNGLIMLFFKNVYAYSWQPITGSLKSVIQPVGG